MRARAVVIATLLALLVPSSISAVSAAPAPTYAIQLSATTRQVGQTFTLTPVVTGLAPGTTARCAMTIGRETAMDNWMRMRVASDGCEPWTFPMPAAALGDLVVEGYIWVEDGTGNVLSVVHATDQVVTVTSGGHEVAWSTNYPVQSWAFKDLVSTATPALGAPFTIHPSAAADHCNIRIVADDEESAVQPPDSCGDWTLTIPDRIRQGPGNLFDPRRTEVTVRGWSGTARNASTTPELGLLGAKFGETFTANLPDFAPPGAGASSSYASNLPAIFVGTQRGHIGDATSSDPFLWHPVVIGTTTGWCQLGVIVPVVPGGCDGEGTIWPPGGSSNTVEHVGSFLIDEHVNTISDTYGPIGWVVPMGTLNLTMPSTANSGQDVGIDASTDAGVPAAWEITAEPATAAPAGPGTPAAAPVVIASGSFDPSVASDGDTLHTTHAFDPGSWTITATFTDVRGDTRTDSSSITVADKTGPTGSIVINGGAAWTTSTTVSLAVPATDAGGSVTTVALSNDGSTWTNRAYAPTQSWTLPATNGARTVYAKWSDAAGNWSSPVSDTIGLDSVVPTATAPAKAFLEGATAGSSTPLRFTWSGSDATSGIARYEAALSTDGGSYAVISTSLTSPTLTRGVTSGHSYRLRVRAVDKAGNVGAWVYGATFSVTRYQENASRIIYGGTWYRPASTSYLSGYEKYATATGASAKITFTGRSFGWIGCIGSSRGSAKVYVNGVLVKTISLYASTTSCRRVLLALSWSTSASRTIKIVVSGTSGHPRVDLDALVTAT